MLNRNANYQAEFAEHSSYLTLVLVEFSDGILWNKTDKKKYGLTILQSREASRDVRTVVEDSARFDVSRIPTNPRPSPPSTQDLSQIVAASLILQRPPVMRRLLPAAASIVNNVPPPVINNTSSSILQQKRRPPPIPVVINSTTCPSLFVLTESVSKKRKRICVVCSTIDCPGRSRKELCSNKCGKCLIEGCTGRHVKKPKTGKRKFVLPYLCVNRI